MAGENEERLSERSGRNDGGSVRFFLLTSNLFSFVREVAHVASRSLSLCESHHRRENAPLKYFSLKSSRLSRRGKKLSKGCIRDKQSGRVIYCGAMMKP